MARFFGGKSRSQKRADNNLGIVHGGAPVPLKSRRCRTPELELIDSYVNGTQYDGKMDWNECECSDEYIPLHKRKPRVIYPYAQTLSNRIASKLVGKSVFPGLKIDDSEDDDEFLGVVLKETQFKAKLLQGTKKFASHGSMFMRFKLSEGEMILEHFNPKYCYPKFSQGGELEEMRIQYVWADKEDLDERGKPTEKWFKLVLGKDKDVLYDNPKYVSTAEPVFVPINTAEHGLGFVQGEWIRTTEEKHVPDGENMVLPITGFIDALNYNLSQSDRAVSYGLDPQLILSGIDEEEMEGLIKSAYKAWNLGKDGTATFAEIQGSGIERAEETRLSFFKNLQDITRVIMLDPEKIVGNAQSAKAMEVLHGPMIELIDELRPQMEKGMIKLLQKMMVALTKFNAEGQELSIIMPPQYRPTSLSIEVTWPQVFPLTIQDMQQLVSVAVQLTNNNIASRQTVLKWIMAKGIDLGIEDVEAEVNLVNTQQQFNTFGGF